MTHAMMAGCLTCAALLASPALFAASEQSSSGSSSSGASQKSEKVEKDRLKPYQYQSPIALNTDEAIHQSKLNLQFQYASVPMEWKNTPEKLMFFSPDTKTKNGVLYNDTFYEFKEFHFHTPAEHLINNQQFVIECHLVHQSDEGKLLAVGIVSSIDDRTWPAIEPIYKTFEVAAKDKEGTLKEPIDVRNLLPKELAVFEYDGSLTTPPYTQVHWIVFAQPTTITKTDLDNFRKNITEKNARELQPLDGREVKLIQLS